MAQYDREAKRPLASGAHLSHRCQVTHRQRDYLQAISTLHARMGYAPTVREVATECSVVKGVADRAIVSLERQGLIARGYATARSMRLTDAGRAALATQEQTHEQAHA